MKEKGFIALDIDGTITSDLLSIPKKVSDYLHLLFQEGWRILFLTGRTLSFAKPILTQFAFPYLVALQNGADILEMPKERLLHRCYLEGDAIKKIDQIYSKKGKDFIIYSGYEKGDFCYFRPKNFSKDLLKYFETLKRFSLEEWKAVHSFDFSSSSNFPLVKSFGDEETLHGLNLELGQIDHLHTTLIRDPLSPKFFLNLVTKSCATKGEALKQMLKPFQTGSSDVIIAAGDDRNDVPMLSLANVRIVMGTAPKEMHTKADIVAAPATHLGIIEALEKTTKIRLA
ncbi:MAG: Cof-type HAD-IIB family hydrolase [Chlamydiae bacterium]|nr:Cof-type HAD-IIB family hydrolase [Chlamydiota bacterium]